MARPGTTLSSYYDIPPEITERIMNDHHMSWVSLSSCFRMQEDVSPTLRLPDFSSWIQMD